MPTNAINARQEFLDEKWATGQVQATLTPVTAMLTSELNSQTLAEDIQYVSSQNSGKITSITAYYNTEPCEGTGSATSTLLCEGAAPVDSISKTYTPSYQYFGGSFNYNPKAFEADIDGGLRYFTKQMARQMESARKGVEKYLTAQLLSLKGSFATAVRERDGAIAADIKPIKTFYDATTQGLDRWALSTLTEDAMYNRFRNAPTIIGGGEIMRYLGALQESGVDRYGFNAQNNLMNNGYNAIPTVYADQWAVRPLENFISYDMGAMPISNPALFVGDAVYDSTDKKAYTMVDPVSGLIFDVKENVTCADEDGFVMNVSITTRVMALDLPDNLYCATGEAGAGGVNGITAYSIANPA